MSVGGRLARRLRLARCGGCGDAAGRVARKKGKRRRPHVAAPRESACQRRHTRGHTRGRCLANTPPGSSFMNTIRKTSIARSLMLAAAFTAQAALVAGCAVGVDSRVDESD